MDLGFSPVLALSFAGLGVASRKMRLPVFMVTFLSDGMVNVLEERE